MADLVEIIVIPEVPRVLDGQEVYVYIPETDYSAWGFNLLNGEYGSTVYQKGVGNILTSVKGASIVFGRGNSAYGDDIIQIGDNNETLHNGVKQFGMYLVSAYSYQTYYGTYNDMPSDGYVRTIIGAGNSDLLFNSLEAGVKEVDEQNIAFVKIGNTSAEVTVPVNDGWLSPTLSMRDIKDAFVVRGQNAGYYLYGRSVNNGVGYENHYPLASNAAADNVAVRDGAGRIKVHVAYDGYDDYSELSPAHIADNNDSLLVPNMAYLESRYVKRDKTKTYPSAVYIQSYENGEYTDNVIELITSAIGNTVPIRNIFGDIIVPNPTYNTNAAVSYGQMTSYVATQIASALVTVYKPQGSSSISALNALTKSSSMNAYVYNVIDEGNLTNQDSSTIHVNSGDNVVFLWNNGLWYWDNLSGIVDLSNYYTKSETDTLLGDYVTETALATELADYQKKIIFTKYEMTTAEAVTSIEYNLHNTETKVLYFIIDSGDYELIPSQTAQIVLVVDGKNINTATIDFSSGSSWKELYFKADCTTPVLERYYGCFRYNTYGQLLSAGTPRRLDVQSITKLTITFSGTGLPSGCPFYVYEGVLA